MSTKFSRRLSARMSALSITTYDVASEVGVSDTAVRNWMSGRATPRKYRLRPLARVLKMKIAELVSA